MKNDINTYGNGVIHFAVCLTIGTVAIVAAMGYSLVATVAAL